MPKQPAKQRIILVDDHEVVRLGLKSLLERHPQFDVIGEAASAREAIEKTDTLKPDVVVMDIRLPGTSGIEACEQIVDSFEVSTAERSRANAGGRTSSLATPRCS